MFAANPGVLAAGAGGKSYAEFDAHITALAVDGIRSWSGAWAPTNNPSAVIAVAVNSLQGTLYGSPFGPSVSLGNVVLGSRSSTCRLVQHCMPSSSDFDALRASGTKVFYRTTNRETVAGVAGVMRNGYRSGDSDDSESVKKVTEFLYWLDGPKRMQPSLGIGPEPYDWED